MADKEKYIAITIGPIAETLSLVSKPAGLWGASYLFSYVTEQLITKIKEHESYEILTPYFEFDKDALYQASRGVGFYHDHIIIKSGDLEVIKSIIGEVKREIGESIYQVLSLDKSIERDKETVISFTKDYIRIYATEYGTEEKELPIVIRLAPLFDGMELRCQTVPVEKENYIASFLDNDIIRHSFLVKRLKAKGSGQWQLFRNTSDLGIKSLPDIAKSDGKPKEWKRYSYYAYVVSDGDHMGNVLSEKNTTEKIREFSKNCLVYNTKACRCVEDFGGIVIYAGGDDLRFLAPLTRYDKALKRQKTIFDLLLEIKTCFQDVFAVKHMSKDNTSANPTVSFGVAISYHKYPLYETGTIAETLLYNAKNSGRDSACIYLQKHSGQAAKYVIHNLSKCTDEIGLLSDLNNVIGERIKETSFNSVLSHITQYTGILEFALKEHQKGNSLPLDKFFENIFVEDTALANEKTRDFVKQLAYDAVPADIESLHSDLNTAEGRMVPGNVWPIIGLLRTAQFFGEAGDPQNE